MMNTKKRWLAALLSVVMVVAMLPSMAFAANAPEAVKNVAFDAKTGTLSWDKVALATGAGYSDQLEVELQERATVSQNDADWVKSSLQSAENVATADKVTFTAVADVATNTAKSFVTVFDGVAGNKAQFSKDKSYRLVVKSKAVIDGKDYFTAVAYTPATSNKVASFGAVSLAKSGAGLEAKVAVAGIDTATDLNVVLYKTAQTVAGLKMVPSDAVKVAEKSLKTFVGNVTTEFSAAEFAYEDPTTVAGGKAKNNYFVAVVGSAAGLDNSAVKLSADDIQATKSGNKTPAPTAASIEANTGKVTITAAKDDVVKVQLFDATNPTKAIGNVETVKMTDASIPTVDMGKYVEKKGLYFVKVTATKTGFAESDAFVSSSQTILPQKVVVAPTAVMDKAGKITFAVATTDDPKAVGIKYVVLYKGNVVSNERTVAIGDLEMSEWGVGLLSGTPNATVETLSDYAVQFVGILASHRDSEKGIVSYGGALSTPTGVVWDENKYAPIAKWNAVQGAEEYVVRFLKANDVVKTVTVKETSVNLLDIYDEIGDGTYKFTVQAKAGYKLSAPSESFGAGWVASGRTAEPKNVKWDGTKATWDAVYGADFYMVKKLVNGKQVGPTKTVTTNSIQFTGLSNPGAYEFVVTAFEKTDYKLGSKAVKSDMKLIEKATVGTPFITNASKTKTTVKLTWTAAANADLYRIYVKAPGQKDYKIIVKEVRGDATAKTVKGLKKGTRYQFKVKAVNNGVGAFSNVKVATTTK